MCNEPGTPVQNEQPVANDDKSVLLAIGGICSLITLLGAIGLIVTHFFCAPDSWVVTVSQLFFVLGATGAAFSVSAFVD
jgi:hypothetical protein